MLEQTKFNLIREYEFYTRESYQTKEAKRDSNRNQERNAPQKTDYQNNSNSQYIYPNRPNEEGRYEGPLEQIPLILMGDFNAHPHLGGRKNKTSIREEMQEKKVQPVVFDRK